MLSRLLIGLLVVCGYVNAQQLTVPGTTNTSTTTYQMGDDGFANVPLPFTFNYYGKSFNNSWMYDNGIISFVEPGTKGAVQPWEWNPPNSLSQTTGNYFIAPLWVDLAPTTGTVYSTTGDGTYLRYDWKNVSEYYSGGTRLNSFSSTIKPNGSISTSYYSLNLESSNMLVGTVGDITKGEVNQLYSASFGTKITTGVLSNWDYKTVNPCDTNPLYSPTCPGYSSSISKLIPTTTSTEPTTTNTEPTATTETTTLTAPQTTLTPATTSSIDTNAQVTVAPVTKTASREATNNSGTSLGLSVITRNQQREQSIVSSAVQNAVSNAESSSMQSQQEAMNVSSIAVSNSNSSNISVTSQAQSVTGIRVQTNNNQFGFATSNTLFGSSSDNIVGTYNNMLTDRTNPLNEYVEPKASMPNNQTFTGSTVNRNAGNNEVAGGVDLTKMAVMPNGYDSYLNLAMRDVAFYAPKEVYKNQKNVDNARVLRQLTNDSRHKDMVEQQYRR